MDGTRVFGDKEPVDAHVHRSPRRHRECSSRRRIVRLSTGRNTVNNPAVRTTSPLAADDPTRKLAIARFDDEALVHLAVVGDTYTVLLSGEQTAGRFAMLDMLSPPGGGPPPHRHNFEECFRVLAGSIEVHLRDLPPMRLEAGDSTSIPAKAPFAFRNPADVPARLLCTVAPAG